MNRRLPLALFVAVAQASPPPCGFQNGFNRPPKISKTVEKCTEQQELFISVEDWRTGTTALNYLPSQESCEIYTDGNNPNCVRSKGHASKYAQCKILFHGKTVKIGSGVDNNDADWKEPFSFYSEGCTHENALNRVSYKTPSDLENIALSDGLRYIYETPEAPAWSSMCFTQTTESPEQCTEDFNAGKR